MVLQFETRRFGKIASWTAALRHFLCICFASLFWEAAALAVLRRAIGNASLGGTADTLVNG